MRFSELTTDLMAIAGAGFLSYGAGALAGQPVGIMAAGAFLLTGAMLRGRAEAVADQKASGDARKRERQ